MAYPPVRCSKALRRQATIAWQPAYARHSFLNKVVIHRGHIGGGRPGVGLFRMLQECRAEHAWLREEDGQQTECFVVGQLRSRFFARQLANFIWEVTRVKTLGSAPGLGGLAPMLLHLDARAFSSEEPGAATRREESAADLTRGLVVNELARHLRSPAGGRGWDVRNDRHRDLMLTEGSELRGLFEVRTRVTTQNICTGLGQLLLYSAASRAAGLVLVLPEQLPLAVAGQLASWQVRPLYYSWADTVPRFQGLSKLLTQLDQ